MATLTLLKRNCLAFFFLFPVSTIFAQTIEPINTDRPDQGDGAYTLPKGSFQIEEGITIEKESLINNFMLRYGITNGLETRILIDAGKYYSNRGFMPVTLSAKQRIIAQKNVIPAITLVGYIGFEKLASKDFSGNGIPAEIKVAFENELSDKFSIGYNIGTSTWFENCNLTFGVGYSPIDKLTGFVEYFSTLQKGAAAFHNFDLGILYIINQKLQLDIAAGRSLFDKDKRMFFTTGFSYRFD